MMYSKHPPHPSIKLFAASGRDLISREIALALSRMLISKSYGKDQLQVQEPLTVSDSGEKWIVVGSKAYDEPLTDGTLNEGPIEIEILKSDCRVIKFCRKVSL